MKTTIILCSLLLVCFISYSQTPYSLDWVKSFESSTRFTINNLITDNNGNIYICGSFNGTADVDPGVAIDSRVSAGSSDIFIAKISPSGNLIWGHTIGGAQQDYADELALDSQGNVVVTGYYNASNLSIDFNPGTGIETLVGAGAFLLKLDNNGNFVWVKHTSSGFMPSLAIGQNDKICSAGYYSYSFDFDPGVGNYTLTTNGAASNALILMLDSNGDFIYAVQTEGGGLEWMTDIVLDSSDNVYAYGLFESTVDFDPSVSSVFLTSTASSGYQDGFIWKLNNQGNFVWAERFGNVSGNNVGELAIDAMSNVFIAGAFSGTADLNPESGTVLNVSAVGSFDGFIIKITENGNFVWAKTIGSSGSDEIFGIDVNIDGTTYYTGYFEGTVDFDPNAGTANISSPGGADAFVLVLDANGQYEWAGAFLSTGYTEGYSISVDNQNNIYTTGFYYNTTDFDPSTGTQIKTPNGPSDSYFVKLKSCESFSTQIVSACNSYTWTNGTTYSSSITATQILTNAAGCDSTITLNLTIKTATSSSQTHSACTSYTLNSQTYTSSGTYTQTLTNAAGCDSTITLNLTINNPTASNLTTSACSSYTLNAQTYNTSGNYTQTLTNAAGCDSTISLNLTINTVDTMVSIVGITLQANTSTATYQWVYCDSSNAPVIGETSQNYTPMTTGNYAVEITENACTELSACYQIVVSSLDNLTSIPTVTIYPNPTSQDVFINFGGVVQDAVLHLYSLDGRLLQQHHAVNGEGFTLSLSELSAAMYFLEIEMKGRKSQFKIVKL